MRGKFADSVKVMDIELSLKTTEYSPNYAGRYLLVRHEVLITKANILQYQNAVYPAYFDVDDFYFLLCGSSLLSQKILRGIYNVVKRVPELRDTFSLLRNRDKKTV